MLDFIIGFLIICYLCILISIWFKCLYYSFDCYIKDKKEEISGGGSNEDI